MFGRRAGVVRRRPLLRAAAVGGGAYMAGKATARRRDEAAAQDASQDQRINDLEQQQQSPAAPVPSQRPADAGSPLLEQLDRLTALHQQGSLSDDEFAAAKAKLLGS
jgi:hypothetical protein